MRSFHRNQARKNPPQASACENQQQHIQTHFPRILFIWREPSAGPDKHLISDISHSALPLRGGKNEWMRLMGRGKTQFQRKRKGSGGDVSDWAGNSPLHAHTQNKRVEKGIFLSIQQRATWELYSCRASGFSGCCCAPGWSQRRRRPAAAGYLLLFSMRASLKANRSGPVRANDRESATGSHLFLRATNQQSFAHSLGSTGNASYKVSHLCSKSMNCCRRSQRVSERARGESGEGIRLVPCRSQNTTPQGWWGYFFLGVDGGAGGGRAPQPPSAHSCISAGQPISHTWKSNFVGTGRLPAKERRARSAASLFRRSTGPFFIYEWEGSH